MRPLYSKLKFTDPDEFCLAAGDWDVDFRQLDSGRSYSTIERLESVGTVINRIYLSRRFHQRGSAPAGVLTLGLPNYNALQSWMGKPIERPALLNFSRMSEYDSTSRPAFLGHTISIADTLFQNIANSIGMEISADQIRCASSDFIVSAKHLSNMHRATTEWTDYCADGGQSPSIQLDLQDDFVLSILTGIGDAVTQTDRSHTSGRMKAVNRAVDYIHSTHGHTTMSDVYEKSLTSWRTLDRGFMERFGVGPKKYLTAARLVGARRALIMGPPKTTIATVAREWGFFHHGRFSADYKSMFGELPSETERG